MRYLDKIRHFFGDRSTEESLEAEREGKGSPHEQESPEAPPPKPITAKVAKVLDEYNLVLNVGEVDGVQKEMRFHVYTFDDENGEVIDPDTGESLGFLGFPYQYVKIYRVSEKFSVAVCCHKRPEAKTWGKATRSLMPVEWVWLPLSSHIKVGSQAQSIKE